MHWGDMSFTDEEIRVMVAIEGSEELVALTLEDIDAEHMFSFNSGENDGL